MRNNGAGSEKHSEGDIIERHESFNCENTAQASKQVEKCTICEKNAVGFPGFWRTALYCDE
ncbi:hypothetical protein PMAYCL1PPCAC_16655 [Pristionchus mayeri]|uniref:Uncharacterized protein n=1 Tax=Pristionchus mayeri TaxID=1317129 RepID=A0AAN5CL74_9BILA|nr:hypothetical protein PMAYCL1PPCAC_16654 [Pristionchus mayeri]GMR46460.1 hypothetical protein PMAYCL1PPCAC_16655 [Pristionchus mayeri]